MTRSIYNWPWYQKKLCFVLFLSAVFFIFGAGTLCAAGDTADRIDAPNAFVYEQSVTKANPRGGLLFLFSSAVLDENYDGYIVSFLSDIKITGTYRGDIYVFCSTVTVAPEADLKGGIHTFSSVAAVPTKQADGTIFVRGISFFDLFTGTRQTDTYIWYTNQIPLATLHLFIGICHIFACMILFALKKSFFLQASVLLSEEPLSVITGGITVYFVLIGLILLFALTVFLIPFALLTALISYLIVLVGETALSVYLGYFILDALPCVPVPTQSAACPDNATTFPNRRPRDQKSTDNLFRRLRPHSFTCLALGVTVIEAFKLVPYIGLSVTFLFLPLLAIGMLATAVTNGFLKKVFYETPYIYDENNKKDFDIVAIRDMIIK